MQTHVQHLSAVEVEVKIEYSWPDVQKDLDQTYQQLQRTATVRGFRKGKAPRHVLQQLYRSRVHEQVAAGLVERGLLNAVREHNLFPVAAADVHPPHIHEGEPLRFTATLEVQPEVSSVDTSGLSIERVEISVTADDIAQELERLRGQHAELVAPDPERATQADDVVTIDYTVDIDDTPHPELGGQSRTWELGSGRVLPELEAGLLGMNVNETRAIDVTLPEDQGQAEFRGKRARFTITLTEVRHKRLAELDDEFAKDCGDFDTLDALKAEIETQLRSNADRQAVSALNERLVDALVEKNPIAVPPSMVAQQQASMLRELAELTKALGSDFQWTEDMQNDLNRRAEKKVRVGLLFGALAKQAHIEVTPDDLEARFKKLAEESQTNIAKVRAKYQGRERDMLMSHIAEERILEYLKNQATMTESKTAPAGDKNL
ncbi:MAG: trigger factor [Myxococcales bacterium]|nr:trigger factor [Myxococcales bacterium]MCB9708331.1 trigger factor [Myxococcales bacterium]